MPVRSRRVAPVVAIALALIAAAAPAAGAVIIDDFEVGEFKVVRSGPNPGSGEQIGLDPAHVLGGGRDILVGENGSAVQTLEFDAPGGVLRFNAAASFGYFEINYGKPGFFINANLAAGASAFLLELPGATAIPPNRITVHTSTGNFGVTATQAGTTITPLAGGGLRSVIPFSLLGPSANLTNVQYLTLEFFRVSQGHELVISHFATIPEPSGLALLACALCCRPLARRRRRAADRIADPRPQGRTKVARDFNPWRPIQNRTRPQGERSPTGSPNNFELF